MNKGTSPLARILWIIAILLLIFWATGVFLRLIGNAIHLALLIALVFIVYNMATGRR